MLKPELQGMDDFVDGINNIVEAQQKVGLSYFDDGSIESAIPPLKILLNIMAYGQYKGKDISDPSLRKQFDRSTVIKSKWYKQRLELKQKNDICLYAKQINLLNDFVSNPKNISLIEKMGIMYRIDKAKKNLAYVE